MESWGLLGLLVKGNKKKWVSLEVCNKSIFKIMNVRSMDE